jgi:hypothetical protein
MKKMKKRYALSWPSSDMKKPKKTLKNAMALIGHEKTKNAMALIGHERKKKKNTEKTLWPSSDTIVWYPNSLFYNIKQTVCAHCTRLFRMAKNAILIP